ncbi:MAG: xanthine dehydrogenase family protein subunit M [Streptosporangiales bacterium]|nr:xanthine dehydrogenase family protein subunit M [Streptosporangiales bacterium]
MSTDFFRPASLREAVETKAAHPDATPIAGGTDVMVELNFDRRPPGALLDLTAVPELACWERTGDGVRLGAAVTYTTVIEQLGVLLPALAFAARTVGSPQIRNRGTVGGNLGAGSPAGDSHPPLLATGAEVELVSVRGTRTVAATDFYVGAKRTALAPDELIAAVLVPLVPGPQQFAKIGPRNAMVIAVCSFALALDPAHQRVGTGIGSAGPTPLRAPDAEELLANELPWQRRDRLGDAVAQRFGELVAAAATPIDDVRGTARYRRHALAVLARRCLLWTWEELRCA